ncbi:DNA-binding transcriptional LysR family regulator [Kaistia hirudinis]|uniref:DNA-binding transcriptional LysR family regulator n=1 Tax=Kaistia hirudinis TaxID=1293440 RepID=A0A840ASZ0_9HYPH|nr:LysR family transcriptional regulator [Kaistia hirudinis]MBB3931921.1 DNA-binding transcriptional LysR family regulator [Kaistia hirudinis]
MRGAAFSELVSFTAVARECSFRRAAVRLGVSPSALSHTIRQLEERLGVRLLNRTTRSVAPTEAGLALLARIEPAIAELEGAVSVVGAFQSRPSGRLRINLPRLAAELVLAPLLADFAEAYPEIRLELIVDDALTDVVAESFDAGIRQGERLHQDMVAVRLTPSIKMAVVGSPAYFARRSPPVTPADLGRHACINYCWTATGAVFRWPFEGPDGPFEIAVEGPLTLNDTGLLRDAALRGVGLAYLPEPSTARDVEEGRLVRLLESWSRSFSGFFLYHPGRRQTPPPLRALIDFLLARRGDGVLGPD